MPLAPKAERANAVLGIHLRSVLEGAAPVDVVMEDAPRVEEMDVDSDEEGALPLAAPAPKATPEKGDRQHPIRNELGISILVWTSERTLST